MKFTINTDHTINHIIIEIITQKIFGGDIYNDAQERTSVTGRNINCTLKISYGCKNSKIFINI